MLGWLSYLPEVDAREQELLRALLESSAACKRSARGRGTGHLTDYGR